MKTINDYPIILSIKKILFPIILILALNSCSNDSIDHSENKIKIDVKEINQGAGAAVRYLGETTFLVKDESGNVIKNRLFKIEVEEGEIIKSNDLSGTDNLGELFVLWTPGKTVGKQIIKFTPVDKDGITLLKNSTINVEINVKPGIGTFYKGGVIFYLDKTLDHGFICAVSDQSSGAAWAGGCKGNIYTGFNLGDGFSNTLKIESACSTPGTAANLCANLILNGYDDWFLPSQFEIKEMFKNTNYINETALQNNGNYFKSPIHALTGNYYWSSTYGRMENTYLEGDINITAFGPPDNNTKLNVRAIRAF